MTCLSAKYIALPNFTFLLFFISSIKLTRTSESVSDLKTYPFFNKTDFIEL